MSKIDQLLRQSSTSKVVFVEYWKRLRRYILLTFSVIYGNYFTMTDTKNGVESATSEAIGSPTSPLTTEQPIQTTLVDTQQKLPPDICTTHTPAAGTVYIENEIHQHKIGMTNFNIANGDLSEKMLSGATIASLYKSSHNSDSKTTQANLHGSNITSGSDSSIYGGSQRHHADQHPLRHSRSRPTSFQEPLSLCRFPPGVLQDSPGSRRSQVDLCSLQQSPLKSSCDLSVNRAATPSHSEFHYSSQRALPLALYKSMSSNTIPPPPALASPFYNGKGPQQTPRPWKYPSSSMVRPMGLPYSISQQSLNSRVGGVCGCQCQCDGSRKPQSAESSSLNEDGTMTTEGLSWRRLHMSRAKLKATATTSELLSGFAMVAMVELQINEPTSVPEWLFVMFSVCTTVLVAVHIFALMISTYLLPNIDAVSKLQVHELVTHSPHERMRGFIELAWAFSTVLGLFLFLVEVAILCWVKFWDYSFTAAWAATIIVIPVLIVFVAFAVHFYHNLVVYKCESTVTDLQQLEDMKKQLDTATCSPV